MLHCNINCVYGMLRLLRHGAGRTRTGPTMSTLPSLSLQTGTLYASDAGSTFTGTGGPYGFSPYTGQFGGVVSSAGLAGEPFADTVYGVGSGDEVIFVVALQNLQAASAYDVTVLSAIPAGFGVPADGMNLTVTDGTGTDLPTSGTLFGGGGLRIGAPIAAYSATSGLNVVLLTYTLVAGATLPGPHATVTSTASVTRVAAATGGADISAAHGAPGATTVVTATPAVSMVAETDASAVAPGQQIAFDVSIPLRSGSLQDLRVAPMVAAAASGAGLSLVSTSVKSVGAGLSRSAAPVVAADGSVAFGTVTSNGSAAIADDTVVLRVVAQATGTASGTATLSAAVSAADPTQAGGRWAATVSDAVGVLAAPPGPVLNGVWASQHATTTLSVRPLGGFSFGSTDLTQTGTLAVSLSNAASGGFSTPATVGSFDAARDTYVMTGSLSDLQAAAQRLVFTPAQAGVAQVNVTVVPTRGGVVQNGTTSIAVTPSQDTLGLAQHFAAAPGSNFLTATADGQQTLGVGEVYQGPVSYLQYQYIYDGAQSVAIIAGTPNVFVKNFVGDAAVGLLSGQNVVDAGKGSNFLVGGTGTDVFFLDGRSAVVTWDTVVGFHAGDIVTLFGFHAATSSYYWEDNAGAVGYTGRTMRANLSGSGGIEASITFAGSDKAATDAYAVTTGSVSGIDYMTIFSL